MADDAEVGSRTSSTIRSAENLSASIDMAEDAEVGGGNSGDDKTVKRSSSKKPNIPTGSQLKSTIGKAIKQSSYWATQGSDPNQSL